MVGGNEECFFRHYWRQRTLFVESAVPELVGLIDYSQFLNEYRLVNCHQATLIIDVDKQGNRRMLRVNQDNTIDEALNKGLSIVLQVLLLPQTLANKPQVWGWFANLHHELCNYLLPAFPLNVQIGGPVAAVDIFCTCSESTSGGHYDTGDVLYFVLDGEKEWNVELGPDMEMGFELASQSGKRDLPPRKESTNITVRPGDCLYVPPYTYHRVCSRGRSLAVSLGLPTFTELTLLRNSLVRMQKERTLFFPLPSYPRTQGQLFHAAANEIRQRSLDALGLHEPITSTLAEQTSSGERENLGILSSPPQPT
jgi:ribosomal protein L16 Arg81 hydroxylase